MLLFFYPKGERGKDRNNPKLFEIKGSGVGYKKGRY
jgi:hypothetical protein